LSNGGRNGRVIEFRKRALKLLNLIIPRHLDIGGGRLGVEIIERESRAGFFGWRRYGGGDVAGAVERDVGKGGGGALEFVEVVCSAQKVGHGWMVGARLKQRC
jgi:hypothetical protein